MGELRARMVRFTAVSRRYFQHVIIPAVIRGYRFSRKTIRLHPYGSLSFFLHALLILLLIFGMPRLYSPEPESKKILSVDIIAPPKETPPAAKITPPEPKKAEPKPKEVKPKVTSPVKKIVSKPKPPPPPPKATSKPKPQPKQTIKPKEQPAQKPNTEEDFAAALRSVQDLVKAQHDAIERPVKPQPQSNPDRPLSGNEISAIIRQISQCWVIPAGARDADNIAVTLRLSLRPDGSVTDVRITDQARYVRAGESFFRAAADGAVRAVYSCSPLKGLPPDKYALWKELELRFDPKSLF